MILSQFHPLFILSPSLEHISRVNVIVLHAYIYFQRNIFKASTPEILEDTTDSLSPYPSYLSIQFNLTDLNMLVMPYDIQKSEIIVTKYLPFSISLDSHTSRYIIQKQLGCILTTRGKKIILNNIIDLICLTQERKNVFRYILISTVTDWLPLIEVVWPARVTFVYKEP